MHHAAPVRSSRMNQWLHCTSLKSVSAVGRLRRKGFDAFRRGQKRNLRTVKLKRRVTNLFFVFIHFSIFVSDAELVYLLGGSRFGFWTEKEEKQKLECGELPLWQGMEMQRRQILQDLFNIVHLTLQ